MLQPLAHPFPSPALPSSAASRPARRGRLFALTLGLALAGGVALAAWSATEEASVREPAFLRGALLPRGQMLDGLLDEADASPTQRDQAHQILDAADADLKQDRVAARADHEAMA